VRCLRLAAKGKGKEDTVAKVIQSLVAHYEIQDVEMGKVYRWERSVVP
jgi:hypothetical protein